MPFFRNKQGAVLYHVHIPKTAGTSILKLMLNEGCDVLGYSKYAQPCSLQHRHKDVESLQSDLKDYNPTASLIILREPLYRLKSAYAWQMMICGTEASQDSFDWWLYSARAALKSNPYTFDNHLRPQAEFHDESYSTFLFGDWNGIQEHLSQFLGKRITLGREHQITRPPLFIPPAHLDWFENYYAEDLKLWDKVKDSEKVKPCANHNWELP